MLSRNTIEQVEAVSIVDLIGKFVVLKKKGANYFGLSPFVDEKSGSFSVSEPKNIWKCFSSGISGIGAVSYVMKKENCEWLDAVKIVAEKQNILLEYDDSERSKKYIEHVTKRKTLTDVNALALEYFVLNISAIPKGKNRTTPEMYEKFALGYAPDEWQGLYNFLISKGISKELALESGLIAKSTKVDKVFDFFRGRIMFPIHAVNGSIIGFSGRDIVSEEPKSKVINSKETIVYSKSNSLLGIFLAKSEITLKDKAILVEGNFDVTALHEAGLENCVGSLGTAFTSEQSDLLLKYTKNVVIAADNDKAGLKAIEKNLELLLSKGFFVEVFVSDITGEDPDDCLKRLGPIEFANYFNLKLIDGVEFVAEKYFKIADSIILKTKANERLTALLSKVSNAKLRNTYVKNFAKKYDVDKKAVEEAVSIESSIFETSKTQDQEEKGYKLPSFLHEEDKKDWEEYGFYQLTAKDTIGYYFPTAGFGFERITNFVVRPLFQVASKTDSKRLVEIKNAQKTQLIELPNKSFVNAQMFEEICSNEGEFWFDGSKKHFQKLRRKLLAQFPFSIEIKTLGWQRNGFWSFANGLIANGTFKKIDENGLVSNNDTQYFLPAFSRLNKEDDENDIYEADRAFEFKQSNLEFRQWAAMMQRVHQDNGVWAVIYLIATIFRDHIFTQLNYFPHLFNFGQPQTGKSTCSRSLSAVFFGHQPPYNLLSGTPVSFFRRLARVKNGVVWFDEYNNDIEEKRFQALKASYDGAGHEKGVMSNDNRTQSTKVNGASVISGQFLPTRDDNSMFTRSILCTFERKSEDLTTEDAQAFMELTACEQKGLSQLIVEVVKFRDFFEENFELTRFETVATLKKELQGKEYTGRVMENIAVMIATQKLMSEKLALPFDSKVFYTNAVEKIISQSEQVKESDALASFWKMVEYLSATFQISENQDYKIITETKINIRKGRELVEEITWNSPKKVFYIQLTKIHPLYMQEHRKQHGINGVSEQSIRSFMKSSKAFLGMIKSMSFESKNTSAFAFDYDMLRIGIKSNHQKEVQEEVQEEVQVGNKETKQGDMPF